MLDYRLAQILSRYDGHKDGDNIRIKCPVHDGSDPNCAVWIDDKDKIAAHCHSHGCAVTKYLWDEFDPPPAVRRGPVSQEQKKNAKWLPDADAETFDAPRVFKHKGSDELTYTKHWVYLDADARPMNLCVVRYDHPTENKKATIPYVWARLDDGREMWLARGPNKPVWYGMNTLSFSDTVIVVEGEKCVTQALKFFGQDFGVVTWLGGSNKVSTLNLDVLEGKNVVLWPDNDEPGHKWAWEGDYNLYDALTDRGIPTTIVDVFDMPKGHDIADLEDSEHARERIKNAVQPGPWRSSVIYSKCAAADELKLTDDQLKHMSCGFAKACDTCRYLHVPMVHGPQDVTNDEVLINYAYIAHEKRFIDVEQPSVIYDRESFNTVHAHLPGYSGTGANSAARQFESSPGTLKTYARDFLPGEAAVVTRDSASILNIWKPLRWTPCDEEPTTWLRIGSNWATESELQVILDHMAYTVQQPGKKINWQILVRGTTGIGKSMFFGAFFRAFQRSGQFCELTHDVLKGGYNGSIVGKKVASIEEVMASSLGYSVENKLKPYAASPPNTLPVNVKFGNQFDVTNVLSIYAQTNNDVPFKLSDEDRRWFVVDADMNGAQDLSHDDTISREEYDRVRHDDSYVDMILSYLSRRDISNFDAFGRAPSSAGKDKIIKQSVPHFRELEVELDDMDVQELVTLADVREELKRTGTIISVKKLSAVMEAYGWDRIGEQVRVKQGNKTVKIRPWITANHDKWSSLDGDMLYAAIRKQWEEQSRMNYVPSFVRAGADSI